jgi:hypothetical protein
MKIDKIILNLSHFFGFRLDQEHEDDISINIPTIYYKGYEYSLEESKLEEENWIIQDIFEQIYKKFKEIPKFEKKCKNSGKVLVNYKIRTINGSRNNSLIIPYIDECLFDPNDKKSIKRHNMLKKLI